jgi:hypothetical protein
MFVQLPQWSRSDRVSMQVPEQLVLGLGQPLHSLSTQVFGEAQTLPHEPQFFESLVVLTQAVGVLAGQADG